MKRTEKEPDARQIEGATDGGHDDTNGLSAQQLNEHACLLLRQAAGDQDHRARAYLEAAARRGLPTAAYNLGILHLTGIGVRPSIAAALPWFGLAAAGGHRQSERLWRWYMALEGILWSRRAGL